MSDLVSKFNDNPLYVTLGIRLTRLGDGEAVALLEPSREVCWPFEGQPHGGVLFTVMDTTMATAVISQLGAEYSSATISIEIQYTARARNAPYTCRANVLHSTRNVSFVRADINDALGQLVAMGQGTFKVINPKTG